VLFCSNIELKQLGTDEVGCSHALFSSCVTGPRLGFNVLHAIACKACLLTLQFVWSCCIYRLLSDEIPMVASFYLFRMMT
jgi:hypothetical protein